MEGEMADRSGAGRQWRDAWDPIIVDIVLKREREACEYIENHADDDVARLPKAHWLYDSIYEEETKTNGLVDPQPVCDDAAWIMEGLQREEAQIDRQSVELESQAYFGAGLDFNTGPTIRNKEAVNRWCEKPIRSDGSSDGPEFPPGFEPQIRAHVQDAPDSVKEVGLGGDEDDIEVSSGEVSETVPLLHTPV
ncbi:hypothetical protein PIB30_031864 [Stylosanthes scabra]|uniref:Uncharacterized protein n=1 Tax=Stylosanthes scabra TaxID=79078 RepID=A0ABU6UAR9_9FABA|nr:hypothetical protein [Stylosanthes scabra]